MNINTQLCGLVLIIVLMVFYIRQKKIFFNTEKLYVFMMALSYINLSLDIMSIVFIEYRNQLPQTLVNVVCKAYLITLIAYATIAILYVLTDIYKKTSVIKGIIRGVAVFLAIISVLVMIFPIFIYEDGEDIYTYGASVVFTYVLSFLLLFANLIIIAVKRKQISPVRAIAVRTWIVVWIVAAIIQFLNNELLIVGFAGTIGVVIVCLKLENPDINIDKRSGMFNYNALVLYLNELYEKNNPFSVISINFNRDLTDAISQSEYDSLMIEINSYLEKFKDAKTFKLSEGEIWFVMSKAGIVYECLDEIEGRFREGFGDEKRILIHPWYYMIDDARKTNSSEDIINVFKYVKSNYETYDEDFVFRVDENIIMEMSRRKEIENLINSAINHDRVRVFYQPIYSIDEDAFISAEALMRLEDEDGNIIAPGQFIEVAEKSGLIIKLGEIVFRKVCEFIAGEHIVQYGLRYIEVNLSIVQCAYKDLAQNFIAIMEEYGVDASKINLEITESASLQAKKILLENMKILSNYGVSFSMDDFGTGQSNLNYIVEMPVDIVKFDYTMTKSYFENKRAKHVMKATVNMVHGMSLKTVAEGIETEEESESMEELGINYIQGYYYSKPVPEKVLIEFLEKRNSFDI